MTLGGELFRTTKDNECSKYAGLSYYTPRMCDPKRAYPWLTDATRPGMLSNKRREVEAEIHRPDFMQWSVYPFDKASSYPSIPGQVRGELVSRPSQFLYMADSSVGAGGVSALLSRKMTFGRELLPMTKDAACPGISSNKKKAVEAGTNRADFLQWSVYPSSKASNYQSTPGQVRGGVLLRPSQSMFTADQLLGPSVSSVGRKDFKDACQGDASINSHNLGKIPKEKVDHVCDSEIVVSAPISNFLRKADDGRLLRSFGCNKYYGSFSSLGSPCQIKDGDSTLMDGIRNERLDLSLTLGHNYEKKRDIVATGRADELPTEHASGMAVADKKAIADNKAIVDYPSSPHFAGATSPTNTVGPTARQNNIPVHVICNSRQNGHRTLGCNHKEKRNFVVSGGVKVAANDEAMLNNPNSTQSSRTTSRGGMVEPNAHPSSESNSNPGDNAKEQKSCRKKKPKAASDPCPNFYPPSILGLLSTGIFDGAPVKYICESQDLILRGVIKGPKIRCSCNECNKSEYIGLCKFERHAGGRSKRPTSHIFFENGKTLYDVFHELKDTSEEKLFDAIQEIAGSVINQLNLSIWKGRSNLGLLPSAPSPKSNVAL